MPRSFLPPEQWGRWEECHRATVTLSGEEARHLARVLRVRSGDRVVLFDGQGREAQALVRRVGEREVLLEVGATRSVPAPPWTLTLAVAVPGNIKIDEIVNQATQLGAGRIIPMVTGRTVARFSPERWKSRHGRLNRIAVEAAKQCRVARVPIIDPLTRWSELLSAFPSHDLVLMATVEGPHEPLASILPRSVPGTLPGTVPGTDFGRLLLLIGPEGDFSPQEIQAGVAAGARRFSLGPSVLRCETAVVAALSVVSFLLREEGKFSRLRP